VVASETGRQPSPDAEWWTTTDVATYLGVGTGTVSAYRGRGEMPEPDSKLGTRTWLWRPAKIIEWQQNRPSKKTRGEEGGDTETTADS
jgi:predicted DNA-binding transcriptional regulator AlpA